MCIVDDRISYCFGCCSRRNVFFIIFFFTLSLLCPSHTSAPRVCPTSILFTPYATKRKATDGALYTPYSLSLRSHFEAYRLYTCRSCSTNTRRPSSYYYTHSRTYGSPPCKYLHAAGTSFRNAAASDK